MLSSCHFAINLSDLWPACLRKPTFRKKKLFSSFINICAHVATNNLTIANLLRKIWPWSFANHGPGYPGFSQTHPWGNQIFAKHIFGHGGFSQNMGKKIFWERSDPDLSQTTVLDIQDFRKHILGETRFSQNIFLGMAVFRKTWVKNDMQIMYISCAQICIYNMHISIYYLNPRSDWSPNKSSFGARARRVQGSIHPRGPLSREILFYVGLATLNLIVDIIYG